MFVCVYLFTLLYLLFHLNVIIYVFIFVYCLLLKLLFIIIIWIFIWELLCFCWICITVFIYLLLLLYIIYFSLINVSVINTQYKSIWSSNPWIVFSALFHLYPGTDLRSGPSLNSCVYCRVSMATMRPVQV